MKKVMIFIFLIFSILQISIITADTIMVGQSGGGEISIGATPTSASLIRTPTVAVSSTSTIGGAGGTSVAEVKTFTLDKTFLPVEVRRGEHYQEQITIINDKTTDLTVNISITDIEKFLFPEEESFVLKPKESKTINFNIYFSENEDIDIYLGKILFSTASTSKFVNVVLDVKRSEEHTSELQSHSFISYAVFCLKKKKQ